MNNYLKNIISESERIRISKLHNSRIKSEFRKLLSEQDPNLVQRNDPDLSPELNKSNAKVFDFEDFIASAKEQVDGFPIDGSVVNLEGHGNVWEVRKDNPDGTVSAKYYLKQDGSIVGPDMKTIAKNKWFTTPIQVKGDVANTLQQTQTPNVATNQKVGQPKSALDTQNLASNAEINKATRQQNKALRKAARQLKRDDKKAVSNCNTNYERWRKKLQNIDITKASKEQITMKENYENWLNACCDILQINFTGLPFCQITGAEPKPQVTTNQPTSNQIPDSEMNPNK
jgi:hypothetical protein